MDYNLKLTDINLRDPFILPDNGKYYLYGTKGSAIFGESDCFPVYVSEDLENWSEPKIVFKKHLGFWGTKNFWVPKCINITKNIICLHRLKAILPAGARRYWFQIDRTANSFH